MELQTVTQTITDPADWDGSLFETQLELVQLAGADFRSTLTVTEIGQGARLLRLSVNQPIKVRSRPLTLRYVATLFDQAHEGHFAGASIEEGRLLVMPPGFDFDASVKNESFSCSCIFVPPEQLAAYYRTLIGEKIESFDALKIVVPDQGSLQWLAAWPALVDPARLESFSTPQRASIQESLRDSALMLLTHALHSSSNRNLTNLPFSGKKSRLAKARDLVRLAEDYANSKQDISIRMVDLCRATKVSERTLQYAFQTCLGISPMNYLKRHRLHQIRQQLKEADPARKETTVSSIASQYGFFHFGDFSKSYKAHFGESPSDTLRREEPR
jgi:AraC family ethanolamine operon transcriptional activator